MQPKELGEPKSRPRRFQTSNQTTQTELHRRAPQVKFSLKVCRYCAWLFSTATLKELLTMIDVSGNARIRHESDGQVYVIRGADLEFEIVEIAERDMGAETTYEAIVHHPQLGELRWTLSEYPEGVENDQETDVGENELIEDVNLMLFLPTAAEERRDRIDELKEWFLARYENPAESLPYISKEGGYQWIWGGPYQALEVLTENFPAENDDVLEAAAAELESAEDVYDWTPIPSESDLDVDPPDAPDESELTLPEGATLEEAIDALQGLVERLPETQTYPSFGFGGDGLMNMIAPPDTRAGASVDSLLEELRAAADDLQISLEGTNAHRELQEEVERYRQALRAEDVSISQVYAGGVRLTNAAQATRKRIEEDDLPPLTATAGQHLETVETLHATYIMSREDGRALEEGRRQYQSSASEQRAIQEAARNFAKKTSASPELFSTEVRHAIVDVSRQAGVGPQVDRSNQIVATTFNNLITDTLRGMAFGGGIVVSAILGDAAVASVPGAMASGAITDGINAAWSFLLANPKLLHDVGAAFGGDLSWWMSLSHVLERIKSLLPGSGP